MQKTATPLVLLTGFEAFAGGRRNPSAEAVTALAAAPPASIRIASAILPVTYAGAGEALRAAIRRYGPDIVVCTGLASGRPTMCVERVAINIDDARIADNDGIRRIDTPVVPGAPAAYFATLPIKAIVARMREAGVPAQVSQTAGTFLCNHVFFALCHFAATQAPGLRGGFIHVPSLPEQALENGEPSMALPVIVTGLRAALEAVRDTAEDLRVAEGATH